MKENNMKAMREALEAISARAAIGGEFDPHAYLDEIRVIAEEALSKPPRNCDVGTAEEQAKRFKAFCLPRVGECSEDSICPAKHSLFNDIGIRYCQLNWAQLPYEAAPEGDNNGSR